ncbi:hypothetical protein [Bradyrhizobium sp. RDI18]|uniref:hypothetical protein n=1 Tax=Bradyrhizobium sp. RDI18 TaxID=3367400 RepID=UPI00370FE0B0
MFFLLKYAEASSILLSVQPSRPWKANRVNALPKLMIEEIYHRSAGDGRSEKDKPAFMFDGLLTLAANPRCARNRTRHQTGAVECLLHGADSPKSKRQTSTNCIKGESEPNLNTN